MAAGTGADTTTGDIWGAVVGISAVVSIVVGLAMQFLTRRRASWTTYNVDARWEAPRNPNARLGPPVAVATLANTGDGDAFGLMVKGLGCVAWLEPNGETLFVQGPTPRETLLPRVASGQSTYLAVIAEPSGWDRASIAIIWTAPPTHFGWLSRRVDYIPLTRLATKPPLRAEIVMAGVATGEYDVFEPPDGPFLPADLSPPLDERPSRWNAIRRWRRGYKLHRHA